MRIWGLNWCWRLGVGEGFSILLKWVPQLDMATVTQKHSSYTVEIRGEIGARRGLQHRNGAGGKIAGKV
jgi:hypothetical protein